MPHIFLTSPVTYNPGQVLQVWGVDGGPFQPLLVLHQVQNNRAVCRSTLLGYYSLRRPGFYLPIKGSVCRSEDEMERGQLYLKAIKVLNCKVKKLKAKVLVSFFILLKSRLLLFMTFCRFWFETNHVSPVTTLLYIRTPSMVIFWLISVIIVNLLFKWKANDSTICAP